MVAKSKVKDDHKQIRHNIGDSLLRFVAGHPDPDAVGALVDSLLTPVLKAAIPGRQRNKDITNELNKGRKAFARKLARKVNP